MLSARTLRVAPRALRLAAAAPQLRRLCTEVAEVTPQAKAIGQLEEMKARLATVVDDIDFGVRSPMFEFTIITSAIDEDAAYAKLQRAAGYVF